MNISISKFKILWKFLFGGKEAVLDYVIDVANNLLAKLADAEQKQVKDYLAQAQKILATMQSVKWLCPSKWQEAYGDTVEAFETVVTALNDLNVSTEEIKDCYAAFKTAYSAWRADD